MLKWNKRQRNVSGPSSQLSAVVKDDTDSSSTQRLSQLFNRDGVNLGLILTDSGGAIISFNELASKLFNLINPRDVGRQITHIMRHPEFVKSFNDRLFFISFELSNIKFDGTSAEIFFVPQNDGNLLIISQDVTERQRLEHVSKETVANLSHELRSPLTVIGGYMEALRSFDFGKNNTKIINAITNAKQQCDRMKHLVENALLLGRLEISTVDEDLLEWVDIDQLVDVVVEDIKHLYPNRQISIDLCKEKLHCIRSEAYSLISNLLSNALRYSDEKSTVEIHWYSKDEHLYLDVVDYGIGIEERFISQLTTRFFRVDKTRSEVAGGNGLGLSIVANILHRYQAELKVTSVPGKGSTFSCRFNRG